MCLFLLYFIVRSKVSTPGKKSLSGPLWSGHERSLSHSTNTTQSNKWVMKWPRSTKVHTLLFLSLSLHLADWNWCRCQQVTWPCVRVSLGCYWLRQQCPSWSQIATKLPGGPSVASSSLCPPPHWLNGGSLTKRASVNKSSFWPPPSFPARPPECSATWQVLFKPWILWTVMWE